MSNFDGLRDLLVLGAHAHMIDAEPCGMFAPWGFPLEWSTWHIMQATCMRRRRTSYRATANT